MLLEEKRMVAGMEQAKADANIQYGISLLHPSLVKLIHSNPITAKKMGKRKPDFSQSLQAIIEDWILFFPVESKFAAFQTYFSRAKKVRHWVAHQSFDRNRYQHYMECLANVAAAIGQPNLTEIILNLAVVKDEKREKQEESISKEEKNQMNVVSLKKDEWKSVKEEGNQLYKEECWEEAMNCYTRAIHLNQGEAVLYANRAQCELRLSKFDVAREDIEDAIQLDPKNVKYFRVLSEALLEMKLHKESLEACRQGLEINPRDEVLILRERDCRALNASDNAAKNSVFGQSTLGASLEQRKEEYAKMQRLIMSLHLTSEDIEDCPSQDKLRKIFQIAKPVDEAQLLDYKGMSSSKKSQEKKAFKVFEAAAKKGSAQGLYNMALFYDEGKGGLPRDFHKAMELCRKAARQKAFYRFKEKMLPNLGVAEAECFLGICYSLGQGVDQCSTKAFEWYLIGARHGNATAQNNLGNALLNGDGCQKNETSARSWFQKAAEQGLSVGQKNYAMVLKKGLGGPTDAKKAAELLKLAADQGDAGSLELLQKLSMSGALGGSAVERTKENLKKAAKKADPGILFLLGQNYQNGTGGFEKDLIQAEQHLKEASKAGYSDANLPLGKLLLELKKNEEAFEFIKLAAEKGSDEGQFQLGLLYAYGHGCDRDEGKARRWLNRAKQQGLLVKCHYSRRGETSEDDWTWVDGEIDLGKKISEFETQQQLMKPKGLSIEERTRCFYSSQLDEKDPSTPDNLELLEMCLRNGKSYDTVIVRSMNDISRECINELSSRAKNGSATAQSFFNACEMVEKAIDLLKQHQSTDAFKLVRFSLREWDRPIVLYSDFYSECLEDAKQALDRNSQDADALYVLAYFYSTPSIEEKLQMAKRCVELDPSVPDFHQFFSSMLSCIGGHRNGLRALDRAIELLPNHPGWLYWRAGFIRLRQEKESTLKNIYTPDVAEAYLTFLSSNPMDHRKFPDACYFLAQIYAVTDDKVKAKAYYQKGLDAEDPRVRLQCFLAEDDFLGKKTTRMLLNAWEVAEINASASSAALKQY